MRDGRMIQERVHCLSLNLIESFICALPDKTANLFLVRCKWDGVKVSVDFVAWSSGDGIQRRVYVLAKSFRTSTAASTLAGLSRLGLSDDRREITLKSCLIASVGELVRGDSSI